MSAKILDGKKVRDKVLEELTKRVKKLAKKPLLSIVLVGNDPASEIYVREKEKAASQIGIGIDLIRRGEEVSQEELESIVENLNRNSKVTGIVVQKPLPDKIDDEKIDRLVDPVKDVDGLNPASDFYPTTARGVIKILKENGITIVGKDAVVVGRSKLSGLPTALSLLDENATVTICHTKTKNLKEKTLQAEILVASAGVPNLITGDMVRKGAVVIDVGTNRQGVTKKIVGDVDFEKVKKIASFITPVPGGIGPMIVAGLMINVVEAVEKTSNA